MARRACAPGHERDDRVAGLGSLSFRLVGGRMKTARVAYAGAVHDAVPHDHGLQLADGRVLAEHEVVWLPPVEVGHRHRAGPELRRPREGTGQGADADGQGRAAGLPEDARLADRPPRRHARPADAVLHALRVRAGGGHRPHGASRVKAADALAHVAGYTVCNDYAVRDYLENWYRPNLRVKNRDGGTVLGPWLVRRRRRARPAGAGAAHHVNGQVVQQGSTAAHDPRRGGADRIPQQTS
jgi:5-oxopent-3-ene-1,2,5-tricarboxylate decarboxylase / 2-hydroxyhepta-2,4-diene-1,7-dioate isomerase